LEIVIAVEEVSINPAFRQIGHDQVALAIDLQPAFVS
jgi:hypothetical protein